MFYTIEIKSDSMSQNLQSFKILFAIGATVLLIGLVFQWYPASVIGGMRERLTQSSVTTEERTSIQDSLDYWNIQQIMLLQPASLVFTAVGILILIYSVLSTLLSIASGYTAAKRKEIE
jgi:hypothetical protein